MANWKEQYLAALEARDETEKANIDLYDYCTKLAKDKAHLSKALNENPKITEPQAVPSTPAPLIGYGIRRYASPQPAADAQVIEKLRADLAVAQRERLDLENRLSKASQELDILKVKSKSDNKKNTQLLASVSQLTTKVRDREEELRGKAKLVESVQDENVTLNLQLNMAEQQATNLRKENQELVDRWMAKMGEEARKMNEAGRFD